MNIFKQIGLILWAKKAWKKAGKTMETKNFLKSKTIWGVLLMGIPWVGEHVGIKLAEEDVAKYLDIAIQVVGFILALWGRFKATKSLTVAPTKPV